MTMFLINICRLRQMLNKQILTDLCLSRSHNVDMYGYNSISNHRYSLSKDHCTFWDTCRPTIATVLSKDHGTFWDTCRPHSHVVANVLLCRYTCLSNFKLTLIYLPSSHGDILCYCYGQHVLQHVTTDVLPKMLPWRHVGANCCPDIYHRIAASNV